MSSSQGGSGELTDNPKCKRRGVCAYCDNERLFGSDTCGLHS